MKPTALQYEIIKQQCNSFEFLGCWAILSAKKDYLVTIVLTKNKVYRFSDPDYNVISMQLSKLFNTLKNKLTPRAT